MRGCQKQVFSDLRINLIDTKLTWAHNIYTFCSIWINPEIAEGGENITAAQTYLKLQVSSASGLYMMVRPAIKSHICMYVHACMVRPAIKEQPVMN